MGLFAEEDEYYQLKRDIEQKFLCFKGGLCKRWIFSVIKIAEEAERNHECACGIAMHW